MAARSALVIATADYDDGRLRRLPATGADADSLARVLGDPAIGAFGVDVLLDATHGVVTRRLSRFFRDRHRDDVLLLHLSCHGIKSEDGRLYFAAKDTDKDDLDATAVASEWLRGLMDRSISRRIVMTLDCCFSGAFGRGLLARGTGAADTSEMLGGRGRAILTATDAVEYALEGDQIVGEGTPSIFTSAVVEGLETGSADRDGDGWVSVDDLYEHVFETVRGSTPNMTPRKWVLDLQGPGLRIARSPRGPRSEQPDELSLLARSPAADIRYAAVEVLSQRLYDQDAQVVTGARSALRTLAGDTSGRVSRAALTALGNERFMRRLTTPAFGLAVRHVAISPDWRWAAMSGRPPFGASPPPALWDLATGERDSRRLEGAIPGAYSGAVPLAFSPDSALLAIRTVRAVTLFDTVRGEERASIPGAQRLVFASDGRLAATRHDTTVRLWTLPDCQEQAALTHSGEVAGMAFVPNTEVVATVADTDAFLWDTSSGGLLVRLAHREPIAALAVSHDGRLLGLAGGPVVSLWEAATGRELSRLDHDEVVTTLAFESQGRMLAVGVGAQAYRWETASGRLLGRLVHDSKITALEFSPDGRLLAIAGGTDASVWETANSSLQLLFPDELGVECLAFSPDSHLLATWNPSSGRRSSTVSIWRCQ